jgi:hypothetical protein
MRRVKAYKKLTEAEKKRRGTFRTNEVRAPRLEPLIQADIAAWTAHLTKAEETIARLEVILAKKGTHLSTKDKRAKRTRKKRRETIARERAMEKREKGAYQLELLNEELQKRKAIPPPPVIRKGLRKLWESCGSAVELGKKLQELGQPPLTEDEEMLVYFGPAPHVGCEWPD